MKVPRVIRCPECKYHTTRPGHLRAHREERHDIGIDNPIYRTRRIKKPVASVAAVAA